MNKTPLPLFLSVCFLAMLVWLNFLSAKEPFEKAILIEFFYEEGCSQCEALEDEMIPIVEDQYGDLIKIQRLPIDDKENYLKLAHYQNQLDYFPEAPVSMIIQGKYFLAGMDEIIEKLSQTIDEALQEAPIPVDSPPKVEKSILEKRLNSFSILGVLASGLIDGMNPCAFTTILFLSSLLLIFRAKRKEILLCGVGFITATYLTYFAIGLGLFKSLSILSSFQSTKKYLLQTSGIIVLIFSAFSFLDAWNFKKGKPKKTILTLPVWVQKTIHKILGKKIKPHSIFVGSFVAGFLVTILETLCTGQVYLPTILWIIQYGETKGKAIYLLSLYNLAFTIPAILVFIASFKGLTSRKLLDLSRQNAFFSKIFLAVFFLVLGTIFLNWY